MEYIEVKLTINPDTSENRDIIAAELSDVGFESFMHNKGYFSAYILFENYIEVDVVLVIEKLSFIDITFTTELIQDQKWNETWTNNYFQPIVFEKELVVHASFHTELPDTTYKIEVDPKMAFGTGNHGTTYMILEEILKTNMSGKSVLDMGTGTGILAILSKMKGSTYTLAVDNDPNSCENTSENIIINNTPDIDVKEGDINILQEEMFDIIYENIWKNTVKADLPILEKHLNPDGIIITSGFYAKEAHEVIEVGEKIGLKHISSNENNQWAVIVFKK